MKDDRYACRLEGMRAPLLTTLRRREAPTSERDDIVQVTILSLLRRRSTLEHLPLAELRAYATRAVIGTLRKAYRSAGRRQRLELAWVMDGTSRTQSGESPIARIEVVEALGSVPPELRGVVVACDLRGLSHSQAAIELGLPLGTVKSRLRKAHGALREQRRSKK